MSKTIKQIADEIGVSKQAVHQKRKNKELSTALQPFTSIVDGVVYISVDGEKLIKSAFSKNVSQTENKEFTESSYQVVDNEFTVNFTLKTLSKQLEEKDKQLAEKDKQIDKLQVENEKLINSLENMTQSLKGEQALHAGTIQRELLAENKECKPKESIEKNIIIESEEIKEKKNFFKRIFGKE